jgi:hypothetical protein
MPIKDNLLKQAELLLKLARSAADPGLSASLVQRAADLKEIADNLAEPDHGPRATDGELVSCR